MYLVCDCVFQWSSPFIVCTLVGHEHVQVKWVNVSLQLVSDCMCQLASFLLWSEQIPLGRKERRKLYATHTDWQPIGAISNICTNSTDCGHTSLHVFFYTHTIHLHWYVHVHVPMHTQPYKFIPWQVLWFLPETALCGPLDSPVWVLRAGNGEKHAARPHPL